MCIYHSVLHGDINLPHMLQVLPSDHVILSALIVATSGFLIWRVFRQPAGGRGFPPATAWYPQGRRHIC